MANTNTVTIAGVTISAASTVSATNVAAVIDQLSAGATSFGSTTGLTITGTLTGYDTATASGAAVTFTHTGGLSGSNTDLTDVATNTAGIASVGAASGATDAVGAYGQGALFFGSTPTRINITAAENATQAITELDNAINGAAAERAKYGSYMSRLQHASDNLQNVSTNTSASLSQIADTDYASETTELARTQIISQASTAMLAQANQVKQTVLSLLQ
jgi:flagellin